MGFANPLRLHGGEVQSLRDELKDSTVQYMSLKDLKIKSKIISLKWDFEENKKDKIAEVLWKLSESRHEYDNNLNMYVCDIRELLIDIGKFIRGFERKLIERRNNFESEVILHKRHEKYMDLNEKLLFEAEVHFPDNCIILDAHDVSLNECIALEFISADEKMIDKVNTLIDLLSIDKFHYLKDFTNN